MKKPNRIVCHYLSELFEAKEYAGILSRMKTVIRKQFPDVQGIAFRGSSGCLIGLPLAHALKKGPIMVRKDKDGSHSDYKVEGIVCDTYIVIDDFVSSGGTVRAIIEKIQGDEWFCNATCVGVVCYRSGNFTNKERYGTVQKPDGSLLDVWGTGKGAN